MKYADPPWQFKTYSKKGLGKSADKHYPTMSLENIKALPVSKLADKDCALFMWTTIPFLRQSFDVMESWGFEYKTVAFVWIKRNRKSDGLFWGTGYWTRANSEICMLATRGNPIVPTLDGVAKTTNAYRAFEKAILKRNVKFYDMHGNLIIG